MGLRYPHIQQLEEFKSGDLGDQALGSRRLMFLSPTKRRRCTCITQRSMWHAPSHARYALSLELTVILALQARQCDTTTMFIQDDVNPCIIRCMNQLLHCHFSIKLWYVTYRSRSVLYFEYQYFCINIIKSLKTINFKRFKSLKTIMQKYWYSKYRTLRPLHLGMVLQTHWFFFLFCFVFFLRYNSHYFILPLLNFYAISQHSFCYRRLSSSKFNFGHPVLWKEYLLILIFSSITSKIAF